jgi:hypothetical protein
MKAWCAQIWLSCHLNHSFDTVRAVEAIEHLTEKEGISFLKQIQLIGKRLVLTTPKEFVQIDLEKIILKPTKVSGSRIKYYPF